MPDKLSQFRLELISKKVRHAITGDAVASVILDDNAFLKGLDDKGLH